MVSSFSQEMEFGENFYKKNMGVFEIIKLEKTEFRILFEIIKW
jgi:hypothetical protein